MDFIFEHEQLRKAEALDRMFVVKNSFTPLRPLKSVVSRKRRNTTHVPEPGQKSTLNTSRHSTNSSMRSMSPLLSKFLKQLSEPSDNYYKNIKSIFNPNQKKIPKNNILPTIESKSIIHRRPGIKLKKTYYPNIVTYIPTILYLPN